MIRSTTHSFVGRLLTGAVLVALTAAWIPRHLACPHHGSTAAEVEGSTGHPVGHGSPGAPDDDQAPSRDCHGSPDAPASTVASVGQDGCCGTDAVGPVCCSDPTAVPVLQPRKADSPRVDLVVPIALSGAGVLPDRPPSDLTTVAGDLPPPGRHRYRDLSVLRL